MKNTLKNIIFLLFIIILISCLFINIIIIKSINEIDLTILSNLNSIYFDPDNIDKNSYKKITDIINFNDSSIFIKLINNTNPIYQFYGFCGLMKHNQNLAIKNLDPLLLSSKKVHLIKKNENKETILGYAILLLIKEFPEWLTNKPIDNFYSLTEKNIESAYKSTIIKTDEDYKNVLTLLIKEKYQNIAKNLFYSEESIETVINKTTSEKIQIAKNLNNLEQNNREKIILELLQEKDYSVLYYTLISIKETDSQKVANNIFSLRLSIQNEDLLILILKKYSLILKTESISQIQDYLKTVKNEKIILAGLDIIGTYGNEELSYEYLKLFLGLNYSPEVNVSSLKTIVKTTYSTSPDKVLRTMLFVINKINEKAAYYAIKFHIEKSLKTNYVSILNRLSKKENDDMKYLAIEYIKKFNLKDGLPLLYELMNDENEDIKQKAHDLVKILE